MVLPISLSGYDLHAEHEKKKRCQAPTVTFAVRMVKVETWMGPWIVDTMDSNF